MDLSVVLTSSVVAALIGGFVAYSRSERKIQIENITQERAKWRSEIKRLADLILTSATDESPSEFERHLAQIQLNLNPFDCNDLKLIEAGQNLLKNEAIKKAKQEFVEHIALLLKHDWERAKAETKISMGLIRPRRISYEEYKNPCCHRSSQSLSVPQFVHLAIPFVSLMLASGVMFFLAVGLTEPFSEFVRYFNDSSLPKPPVEWGAFLLLSVIFGSLWAGSYLWFKYSEKRFLERVNRNES